MKMNMFGSTAQAQAHLNNRMNEWGEQHLVLLTTAFPTFVEMAGVQAGESVLDVGVKCGEGKLLSEIVGAVGATAGMIVALDKDRLLLKSVVTLLKSRGIRKRAKVFQVDMLRDDHDAVARDLDAADLPTTYDTIFAVEILPPGITERATMLRTLASHLTPSGRMIVTFKHGDEAFGDSDTIWGEIAGAVRFDGQNKVHHRISWMLESEWVRAERDFRALAGLAGLVVAGMRRVGFYGAEVQGWIDDGVFMDGLTRGDLTAADTDAEGNPTVAFKNQAKQNWINGYNGRQTGGVTGEGVLVGACLVAILRQ